MLDFVNFIDTNWTADAETKQAFLDDFVSKYGYENQIVDEDGIISPNPVTKADFANEKIKDFIIQSVNAYRANEAKKQVTYSKLEIT